MTKSNTALSALATAVYRTKVPYTVVGTGGTLASKGRHENATRSGFVVELDG
jgi:hypothetical protein